MIIAAYIIAYLLLGFLFLMGCCAIFGMPDDKPIMPAVLLLWPIGVVFLLICGIKPVAEGLGDLLHKVIEYALKRMSLMK